LAAAAKLTKLAEASKVAPTTSVLTFFMFVLPLRRAKRVRLRRQKLFSRSPQAMASVVSAKQE